MTPKERRRALLICVVFPIFGVALHCLAPTLNGLRLAGLPLGYWIAAQGGALLLAFALVWLSSGKTNA